MNQERHLIRVEMVDSDGFRSVDERGGESTDEFDMGRSLCGTLIGTDALIVLATAIGGVDDDIEGMGVENIERAALKLRQAASDYLNEIDKERSRRAEAST